MILGYEAPVDIPTMSMYDKDMMKLYLTALKEDYDLGVKLYLDFVNNSSTFVSPLANDNLRWLDITINPLALYLNENPDAIRSIEGRAAILRYINTRPLGEMANIKATAENAKKYQDAYAALQAKGQAGPQDFINAQTMRQLLNWDTAKNGIWQNTAPVEYQPLDSIADRLTKNVKEIYLGHAKVPVVGKDGKPVLDENGNVVMKNDPFRQEWGNTVESISPTIAEQLPALLNDPNMQYYLDKFGGDRDKFVEAIARASGKVGKTIKTDDVAMNIWKQQQEAAQKAADRANAMEIAKMKDGNNDNKNSYYSPVANIITKLYQRPYHKWDERNGKYTIHHKSKTRDMEIDPTATAALLGATNIKYDGTGRPYCTHMNKGRLVTSYLDGNNGKNTLTVRTGKDGIDRLYLKVWSGYNSLKDPNSSVMTERYIGTIKDLDDDWTIATDQRLYKLRNVNTKAAVSPMGAASSTTDLEE